MVHRLPGALSSLSTWVNDFLVTGEEGALLPFISRPILLLTMPFQLGKGGEWLGACMFSYFTQRFPAHYILAVLFF